MELELKCPINTLNIYKLYCGVIKLKLKKREKIFRVNFY